MTDKFISIEGIAKRYPGADGGAIAVFEDLWLSMARGEFGCVIGHSGCGKTTVLNILAGLDQPSDGTVIVDGQAIEGTSLDRAVIFQSHALLPWRTVLGNVAYAVTSKWRNWDRARVKAHAQTFIDLVGLGGSEHKRPSRRKRSRTKTSLFRPSPPLRCAVPFWSILSGPASISSRNMMCTTSSMQ